MKQILLRVICFIKGHQFNRIVIDDGLEFCTRCHEKEVLDRTFDDIKVCDYDPTLDNDYY